MTTLSTHALDAARGVPAAELGVALTRADGELLASAGTDADGRISWDLTLDPGHYILRFATGDWFADAGQETFFPIVTVSATLDAGHHHVALLLSPFSYTTYKGS